MFKNYYNYSGGDIDYACFQTDDIISITFLNRG